MAIIHNHSQTGGFGAGGLSRLIPARLPSLEGARGTVVRSLYAAIALAVLVVILGSFWFNLKDRLGNIPTAAEYGFRTRTTDGIPEIATVSQQAVDSGLRERDRILSIDGRALSASATEFTIGERLSQVPDGQVTIVTRSTNGSVRQHVLSRVPLTRRTIEPGTGLPLWAFIAIGFGSAQLPLLIWFGASLLLAWRRPRDPEAMLFAFAFLLMCVTGSSAFWLGAVARLPEGLFDIIANLGATLILAAIAAFPDGQLRSKLSRVAIILLGLLIVAVFAVPLANLPTWTMDWLAIAAILAVLGSIWLRYRGASQQIERQQIKWAVFGFCSALLIFLPVLIASQAGAIPAEGPWEFLIYTLIVPFAFLLIPIGLLVSLLRYRLYDAEAAISRSAAYATLTLLLAAIFAASAEGLEWLFETNFGRDAGALPGAIAAGLAVLAITPLNSRIQRWAEERFQKGLVRLRRDLPECVADMREISTLDRLLETTLDRLVTGVRAERAAMVVGRDVVAVNAVEMEAAALWLETTPLSATAEGLDCDRYDPVFPLRVPLRIRHDAADAFGWILLGPRPDHSFYGRDERETLADLADPIARSVQIVLVREARQAEADRQTQARDERLSALERKLAEATNAIATLSKPPVPRAT